jgi:quinol-cytochrome oxidoreductase complex cytochrome b subunit
MKKKTTEQLPLSFKILQGFFWLTVVVFGISLLFSLFVVPSVLRPSQLAHPSVFTNILGIILGVGILQRKRWAWILNMISNTIGFFSVGLYSFKYPDYETAYLIMIIIIMLVLGGLWYHRKLYDR